MSKYHTFPQEWYLLTFEQVSQDICRDPYGWYVGCFPISLFPNGPCNFAHNCPKFCPDKSTGKPKMAQGYTQDAVSNFKTKLSSYFFLKHVWSWRGSRFVGDDSDEFSWESGQGWGRPPVAVMLIFCHWCSHLTVWILKTACILTNKKCHQMTPLWSLTTGQNKFSIQECVSLKIFLNNG